ncbi:MAG: hypothetical protein AAGF12_00900 [Myxococcota bacterium]
MASYRTELLRGLSHHGWERHQIHVAELPWWIDEAWMIRSARERWGFEAVVTFLVDPLWEQPRKKGQGVHRIAATRGQPSDRLEAEAAVGLRMRTGNFHEELSKFLEALDQLRRGPTSALRFYAEQIASNEKLASRFPFQGSPGR